MSWPRVLFIAPLSGLGGGETSLLNLMCALKKAGEFEPVLWLFQEGPLGERARDSDIEVHVSPLTPLLKRVGPFPVPPVGDILLIRRFIRDHKISLIHMNGLEAIWSVTCAARICGVPVVWTCYGPWQQFKTIHRLILTKTLGRIIGTTQPIISYLHQQGFSAQQTVLIPLGVDLERIRSATSSDLRRELGLQGGSFLVGVVARFQYVKGQDTFVQAATLAAERNHSLNFLLVGGTPFGNPVDVEFRKSVVALAGDERLRGRVFFLGERSDVASIMKGLDLLVLPSRSESFGMVLIEAMAANCPVLATACEGPSVIVTHERTGLLVPLDEPHAMAAAILRLAEDQQLRRMLAEEGFANAYENYSVVSQASRTSLVYRALLVRGTP